MTHTTPLNDFFMAYFKFLKIIKFKLIGKRRDFFLRYKYKMLRKYYGKKCLDVGCGIGMYSEYLSKKKHKVYSIDIVEHEQILTSHNFKLFNGVNVPYENKLFDTSVLMFVLHHTNTQQELIADCIRVTKKYIIIGEDVIQNQTDKIMGNIHLNSSPWSKGSDSFKTNAGWLAFFESNNLKLVHAITIPRAIYPVYPVTRKIYVLKILKEKD